MESNGTPGCIQVSEVTAKLIMNTGNEHWVVPRDEMIHIKGKGPQQTYWLVESDGAPIKPKNKLYSINALRGNADRQSRLVAWNTQVLEGHLKRILALRRAVKTIPEESRHFTTAPNQNEYREELNFLPRNDRKLSNRKIAKVKLPSSVLYELHAFITEVARMYRDNPFHNFAHASHVVMAMNKFVGRIVSPIEAAEVDISLNTVDYERLHGVSDPLALFALVFSALIRKS